MASKKKASTPLTDDQITSKIATKLRDAVGFSNDNISYKQERGLELYNREQFDGDKALGGRSKYVSPDVAERVDWLGANLLKIFDSQSKVVEFTAQGPEDVPVAKQMTDVLNAIVRNMNSHVTMLTPWIKNGLITGLGIVNVDFYEDKCFTPAQTLKGVSEDALVQMVQDEDDDKIQILSRSEPYDAEIPPQLAAQGITPDMLAQMGQPMPQMRDIKMRKRKNTWKMRITNVKPEDFFVSKDADFDQQTGGIKARIQGHKCVMPRAQLLEMGFDEEQVEKVTSAQNSTTGIGMERSKQVDFDEGVSDVEDDVDVYEVYTRLDIDGDGFREHVHLTIAGDLENAPVLLAQEEVSEFYPYAAFCPFPLPNTLFGHGIADKIGDDQKLISRIMRASIDGLNASVNPMKVVNPETVNLDDLLNPHPGKLIRSSDPTNGINYVNVPFSGGPAMQFVDVIKSNIDYTTGVGGQMMAVDASDLQNATATASSQRANSMQLLVEQVARYFADTGYSYLFRIMTDLLVQKPEGAQVLISRLLGNAVPITTDNWDPSMDMSTNVAFGVMNKDYNQAMYTQILNLQMNPQALSAGVSTPQNVYHTVAQMVENAGFKNVGAFFNDPSKLPPKPEQPQPPSPEEIQAKIAQAGIEQQAHVADQKFQLELLKLKMDDDLARDQMVQDRDLKAAEINAKYGAQVNIAAIQAEQNSPSNEMQADMAQLAEMMGQMHGAQQAPQPQAPMPPQGA
ncbi:MULTISPECIES: hypothetical protein [unclassified Rhizobium]|uniref:portal protein n=1 Tax=unclassified Rhizobium TaxID=2613769 RepID=UPI00115F464E|nr:MULTISPECIES: hypothetical protein [unclassified Rhizobium]TQX90264.1 hypothetical protein EQW76_11215 [Rhizobium sp. rho-13.1]TQY16214.1 hypothetical protein EQW74_10805 [Rhizobium sp. rho-1.1]